MTEEWARVASVSDLRPGEVIQVEVDDEPVALANVGGEFLATSDICSHEFEYLSQGFLDGEEIECPRHGSLFNMRTGKELNPPATEPVAVYDVKVEGDEIFARGPYMRAKEIHE